MSVRIVDSAAMQWAPSPSPTVWRKRLEQDGPREAGRVTSVVRYDPGSRFHSHPHPQGEEILVLEGIFSDEHGDYPAGSYLLNPEGFSHAPHSEPGCVLFVKLKQYAGEGRRTVRVDTTDEALWQPHPELAGVEVLPLYSDEAYPDMTHLVRIAGGAQFHTRLDFPGGEEIFVIEGRFEDEYGSHGPWSWAKYPAGSGHTPTTAEGCVLYVKKGHLRTG